ncbi:hypothetical protein CEXT_473301 [Caerostris extrusa]|uniref:Uncharacterized protein n=1 Tax=Caerostris extrusa TaxID=172846 RepID=A0AAV4S3J8_CAEEX|nr:hypothetical protein CEXT_473301 [Caerostris extrusa]
MDLKRQGLNNKKKKPENSRYIFRPFFRLPNWGRSSNSLSLCGTTRPSFDWGYRNPSRIGKLQKSFPHHYSVRSKNKSRKSINKRARFSSASNKDSSPPFGDNSFVHNFSEKSLMNEMKFPFGALFEGPGPLHPPPLTAAFNT